MTHITIFLFEGNSINTLPRFGSYYVTVGVVSGSLNGASLLFTSAQCPVDKYEQNGVCVPLNVVSVDESTSIPLSGKLLSLSLSVCVCVCVARVGVMLRAPWSSAQG